MWIVKSIKVWYTEVKVWKVERLGLAYPKLSIQKRTIIPQILSLSCEIILKIIIFAA